MRSSMTSARATKSAPARQSKLSQPAIVSAALAMIERDGLAGLSARKLAASLNCEAMSLYYHFRNMDVMLDAIVDALLTNMAVSSDPGSPVDSRLQKAGSVYLELARAYPNGFQLVATRRWRTPNALAAVRTMVDCFVDAGFPPAAALGKSRILAAYLNGAGLAIAAWRLSDSCVRAETAEKLADIDSTSLTAATVQRDLLAGLQVMIAAVLRE